MPAKEKTFAAPRKPHSLKRIVKKILDDPEYGRYIHRHVVKARKGDREAARTVRAHFKPERSELARLGLRSSAFNQPLGCPTTTHAALLEFAAHV
jgi:hypothetical protein